MTARPTPAGATFLRPGQETFRTRTIPFEHGEGSSRIFSASANSFTNKDDGVIRVDTQSGFGQNAPRVLIPGSALASESIPLPSQP